MKAVHLLFKELKDSVDDSTANWYVKQIADFPSGTVHEGANERSTQLIKELYLHLDRLLYYLKCKTTGFRGDKHDKLNEAVQYLIIHLH